jgi:hypothetical protein
MKSSHLTASERARRARIEREVREVAAEEGVTIWQHGGLWHLEAQHCRLSVKELWLARPEDIRRSDCRRADRYR